MKIVVTSKKPVYTVERGRLPRDIPIDVSDALGKFLLQTGEAVLFEVKERMDRPIKTVGVMEQSSASPAVQASQQMTPESSLIGIKRRGRKKKEAALLQTQLTE